MDAQVQRRHHAVGQQLVAARLLAGLHAIEEIPVVLFHRTTAGLWNADFFAAGLHRLLGQDHGARAFVHMDGGLVTANDRRDGRGIGDARHEIHRRAFGIFDEQVVDVRNLAPAFVSALAAEGRHAPGKAEVHGKGQRRQQMRQKVGADPAGVIPITAKGKETSALVGVFRGRAEPLVPIEVHARFGHAIVGLGVIEAHRVIAHVARLGVNDLADGAGFDFSAIGSQIPSDMPCVPTCSTRLFRATASTMRRGSVRSRQCVIGFSQ